MGVGGRAARVSVASKLAVSGVGSPVERVVNFSSKGEKRFILDVQLAMKE